MGMVENGQYKIFMMERGMVTPVTEAIDLVMDRIIINADESNLPKAAMHGSYYLLFADTGTGVEPYIALNVDTGAVVQLDGSSVTAAVTADAYGKIILGSNGILTQFPGYLPTDTNGTEWEVETQRTNAGVPFNDNKYRKFWSNIDTLTPDNQIVSRDETVNVELDYDDDTDDYAKTVTGRDTAIVNMQKRSNSLRVKLSGTAAGKIRLNDIGIAVRDRKSR
jgi:hypothetical protein